MRLDLVNLFPVKLDLKPFIDAWGSAATFKIYAPDDSLNFCGADVAPEAAGTIQTNDVYTTTGDPLCVAELTGLLHEGIDIDPSDYLGNNNAPGVLAFEAKKTYGRPTLAVLVGDHTVFRYELPISLSSVKAMYRWRNMRALCGGSVSFGYQDALGEPGNLPDGETNGKDIFFLHGFNVSEADARNWANQVFKRMWLSGSRARFHGIAWYGDFHYVSSFFNGLHYHQDVYHALQTASAFKGYVETAQPDSSKRIVMAQSLGNMVASEALRQGLAVNRYFMFDAAVASEAFDGTLQDASAETRSKYVPTDWNGYTNMCWAANWHRWFGSGDARSEMGWPDYFSAALTNAGTVCNYYSSGDEIFEEMPSTPSLLDGVFHWPTLQTSWPFVDLSSMFTPDVNVWQKQEVLKGVDNVAGTLAGGWGFHFVSNSTPTMTTWRTYTPDEARAMVEDGSIVTNAVFARTASAMFDPSATQDARFETLAKYVPAVSTAAGKVAVFEQDDRAYNLNSQMFRNGWGRNHPRYGLDWLHSDMKDMAYHYVFPLYNIITEKVK